MSQVPAAARPRVLVVGNGGPVLYAIVERLEASCDVRRLRRGFSVEEEMERADAVLLLEAARPLLTAEVLHAYESAAAAIAHGLRSAATRAVMSVTFVPARTGRRARVLERYAKAETTLADAGAELVVLRCCGAVGTPTSPGPSDRHLMRAGERAGRLSRFIPTWLTVPAGGLPLWSPVTTDDLANMVERAVTGALPAPGVYSFRGDETRSTSDVLRVLNPPEVRHRHRPKWLWRVSPGRHHLPDSDSDCSAWPPVADAVPVTVTPLERVWPPPALLARAALERTGKRAKGYQGDTARLPVTAFLILTGLFTASVGLIDALVGAPNVGTRLTAVLLLAGGALMIAAGMLTFGRHPLRFVLGFLASVAIALTSLALFLASAVSGGGFAPIAFGSLVWGVVAAAVAALLWTRGGLAVAAFVRRGGPAFFTSIVTVGTIAGFAQFWYQNVYVPRSSTPVINIDATMEQRPVDDGRSVIEVVMALRNPTTSDIAVAGSHFDVVALAASGPGRSQPNGVAGGERDRPFGRADSVASGRVLRSGEVVEPGMILAPGGQYTRRFSVGVDPADRGATLRVRLATVGRQLDQIDLDVGEPRVDPSAGVVYRHIDIGESSAWRWLTRGERRLFTVEAYGSGGIPSGCAEGSLLVAYVARPEETTDVSEGRHPVCAEDSVLFDGYYAVTVEESSAELALSSLPRE